MASRNLRSRAVALVAAYAVALQALLVAFGPAVPPALSVQLAVLCSGDASAGASHPQDHSRPCQAMCAFLGHAASGPLPPAIAAAPVAVPSGTVLRADGDRIALRIAGRGPHNPRAPPLA